MNKLDGFWRSELAGRPEVIEYIEFLETCLNKLHDIGDSDDYHGLWEVIDEYEKRRKE